MINKIKSSLDLKISLMLAVVLFLFLGISWFFAAQSAKGEMTEYYQDIAKLVTNCTYDFLDDYIDDPDANIKQLEVLGKEMSGVCSFDLIDMVYVVKEKDDDSKMGDTLLISLEDTIEIKGKNDYSNVYVLDPQEEEIMSGNKNSATIVYESRLGKVVSFLNGYDVINKNTGENKRIIVGINVTMNIFNSSVGDSMLRLFWGNCILIIFFILIVRIIIHRIAITPFRVLSESMRNFIQNKEMNFVPLKVEGQDERAKTIEAFNIMGDSIGSYVENIDKLEGEKQKNIAEIKIASEIQRGLVPEGNYEEYPFVLKGYMKPAQVVGGDLYYYHRLDENRIAFAIGDVSGKGISAAFFMASTISAIKYNLRNCTSPAKTISAVNNDIVCDNPNRLFVTLFVGILDAKEHTLTYCNAGHNLPYKIGEKLESLTGGKGIFAGIFENEKYEDAVTSFEEGDKIFLYTDGVTEAVNGQKEFFGEQRLKNILNKTDGELIENVTDEMDAFINGAEQHDDITILTLGFSKKK
ncbi:MAG: PP2C family protein-serine/threonine phosphatase [Eubacteriales bacterium]|nr:PP2C family protein-serine/threonine phosphatase [Eubacteriales bacterium]